MKSAGAAWIAIVGLLGCGEVNPTALTVVMTSPEDGAVDVERSALVSVTFSNPLDRDGTAELLGLEFETGNLQGQVEVDALGTTVTLEPEAPLALLGSYRATVAAGTAADNGSTLDGEYSFEFQVRDGRWTHETLPRAVVTGQLPVLAGSPTEGTWLLAGILRDGDNEGDVIAFHGPPGEPWQAPVVLATEKGGVSSLDVAVAAAGRAVAIWSAIDFQAVPFELAPLSASLYDGTAWSDPEPVQTSESEPRKSSVGFDESGNVIVVWVEDSVLVSRRHIPGAGWQPQEQLSTGEVTDASSAVFLADGRTLVAWGETIGEGGRLRLAQHEQATGWSLLEDIEPSAAGEISSPVLAAGPSGELAAFWIEGSSPGSRAVASYASPGGDWEPAAVLDDDGGLYAEGQLMFDAGGVLIAVWSRVSAAAGVVKAAHRASGDWDLITLDPDIGPSLGTALAVDPRGHAVAAWTTFDDGYLIKSARYVAGEAWSDGAALVDAGVVSNAIAGAGGEFLLCGNTVDDTMGLFVSHFR